MVVELRLPLVDWLVCESQEDTPLVHQSCTDTACPHVHTHVVAPEFLIDQRVQSKYFGGRLDAVCWGAGRRWGGGRAGFLGVVILELNCER